jgi:hypothetical protein
MGLSRWILFVSSTFQGYYSCATSQHMTTNRANYPAARCLLFLVHSLALVLLMPPNINILALIFA